MVNCLRVFVVVNYAHRRVLPRGNAVDLCRIGKIILNLLKIKPYSGIGFGLDMARGTLVLYNYDVMKHTRHIYHYAMRAAKRADALMRR